MARVDDEPNITGCIVLVCGLPGCGKSSFCAEFMRRTGGTSGFFGEQPPLVWEHVCFDAIEAELRPPSADFDPSAWKLAQERPVDIVLSALASDSNRVALLLDDNMYYRSMRKRWYHLAQQRRCAFRMVFLDAPKDPVFSTGTDTLRHMTSLTMSKHRDGERERALVHFLSGSAHKCQSQFAGPKPTICPFYNSPLHREQRVATVDLQNSDKTGSHGRWEQRDHQMASKSGEVGA